MSDLCDEIARMGKGIGSTSRYRIIEALMKGPMSVSGIVKRVRQSQPHVSQNLKILKESKLVNAKRDGQEIYYEINVEYMAQLLQKLALDVRHANKK